MEKNFGDIIGRCDWTHLSFFLSPSAFMWERTCRDLINTCQTESKRKQAIDRRCLPRACSFEFFSLCWSFRTKSVGGSPIVPNRCTCLDGSGWSFLIMLSLFSLHFIEQAAESIQKNESFNILMSCFGRVQIEIQPVKLCLQKWYDWDNRIQRVCVLNSG